MISWLAKNVVFDKYEDVGLKCLGTYRRCSSNVAPECGEEEARRVACSWQHTCLGQTCPGQCTRAQAAAVSPTSSLRQHRRCKLSAFWSLQLALSEGCREFRTKNHLVTVHYILCFTCVDNCIIHTCIELDSQVVDVRCCQPECLNLAQFGKRM